MGSVNLRNFVSCFLVFLQGHFFWSEWRWSNRQIAINSLIDLGSGEQTAQACEIA